MTGQLPPHASRCEEKVQAAQVVYKLRWVREKVLADEKYGRRGRYTAKQHIPALVCEKEGREKPRSVQSSMNLTLACQEGSTACLTAAR